MPANKRTILWALLPVLLLSGYLSAYPLLWETKEATMFAMTVDRGCIRKTCLVPALRSKWLARGPLNGPVTALYRPMNAVLYADAHWR